MIKVIIICGHVIVARCHHVLGKLPLFWNLHRGDRGMLGIFYVMRIFLCMLATMQLLSHAHTYDKCDVILRMLVIPQ